MPKYLKILLFLCTFIFVSPLQAKEIKLATTTSTKSSGLLDKLIPVFEESSGYNVKVFAVGTGKALKLARQGKVDVLLAHAPIAEIEFVNDGYGIRRTPIMKNNFIIVGPKTDPAGIHNMKTANQALRAISGHKSLFVSRADDSGTHKKELNCWQEASIEPYGDWYFELGGSMAEALNAANTKQAYLLIDKGTWLARRSTTALVVHVDGDPVLDNPYSIIAVNPKLHKHVNSAGANALMVSLCIQLL